MAKPKPKQYFLPPQIYLDSAAFRGAIRAGRGLEPIIDGEAIFSALEEAVAAAEKWVLFAFWSFETTLKLLTTTATQGRPENWAELLLEAAKREVRVRILISDFDPVFNSVAHVAAWIKYRELVKRAAADKLAAKSFQVVCARHEAEMPAEMVKLAGLTGAYDLVVDQLNAAPLRKRAWVFSNSPGLWEIVEWKPDNTVALKSPGRALPVFPASHHQKIVVVDGRVAFLGGINLISANLDDRKHNRVGLPWHDAFVRIEGDPVTDIRGNFIGVWNESRTRCEAFLNGANATSKKVQMPIATTTALSESDLPISAPDVKKKTVICQVHRTISRRGKDPRGVPDVVRRDVLDGWLQAIGLAQDFIYIENQYFREQEIADALIARHAARQALRTVIVLPLIAEELLRGEGDLITKHGAALQFKALNDMKTKIGANLGLFGMARPKDAKLVYVHTKVLLIDDVYGNLGSANANPRSFRMDSELNLAWYAPDIVRKLRLNLWAEQLGKQPGMAGWKPRAFVTRWTKVAQHNQRAAPRRRTGFAVPFVNDFKGNANTLIPDELANLLPAPTEHVA